VARSPKRKPFRDHGAAHGQPRSCAAAFTLLELIVVVAVLAIIAGSALVFFSGTEERAATGVARSELSELRKAVLRFRLDTGHLPKRGPFALVADGGRIDPTVSAHWPAEAPAAAADRVAWFYSPANFYQLYERREAPSIQVALDVIAGPGRVFNPESGRGYRGPYLSRSSEGYVYVGDGLASDGSGDPASGDLLDPVFGVADPFMGRPTGSNLFQWVASPLGASPDGAPVPLGHPYLLFVHVPAAPGDLGPRIVCLGPNGTYDSDEAAINSTANGDDLAVFLLE
jgi:prepilin-type N-terminal cleavage/methylation domain-containing protein